MVASGAPLLLQCQTLCLKHNTTAQANTYGIIVIKLTHVMQVRLKPRSSIGRFHCLHMLISHLDYSTRFFAKECSKHLFMIARSEERRVGKEHKTRRLAARSERKRTE